jgi:hypothetical protein
MEKPFEFVEYSNERLRERGQHLGKHILLASETSSRYIQMSREINHIIFELTARTIAEVPTVGVQ